ncbi:hypothetical protein PR048_033086 [Dryococelus australis]|uniref:Uncharacterized protein n=1 Tax=Dryococelus australis TaxID=614101 RepID=A0ABQ9FZ85_9NEOP|nr:hypothetical protein PR048_033086 [Dryococelus australis]
MRVIEVSMEQRRNERACEMGDPRENPPTNGIVRHDSHLRKSGDPWVGWRGWNSKWIAALNGECLGVGGRWRLRQVVEAPPPPPSVHFPPSADEALCCWRCAVRYARRSLGEYVVYESSEVMKILELLLLRIPLPISLRPFGKGHGKRLKNWKTLDVYRTSLTGPPSSPSPTPRDLHPPIQLSHPTLLELSGGLRHPSPPSLLGYSTICRTAEDDRTCFDGRHVAAGVASIDDRPNSTAGRSGAYLGGQFGSRVRGLLAVAAAAAVVLYCVVSWLVRVLQGGVARGSQSLYLGGQFGSRVRGLLAVAAAAAVVLYCVVSWLVRVLQGGVARGSQSLYLGGQFGARVRGLLAVAAAAAVGLYCVVSWRVRVLQGGVARGSQSLYLGGQFGARVRGLLPVAAAAAVGLYCVVSWLVRVLQGGVARGSQSLYLGGQFGSRVRGLLAVAAAAAVVLYCVVSWRVRVLQGGVARGSQSLYLGGQFGARVRGLLPVAAAAAVGLYCVVSWLVRVLQGGVARGSQSLYLGGQFGSRVRGLLAAAAAAAAVVLYCVVSWLVRVLQGGVARGSQSPYLGGQAGPGSGGFSQQPPPPQQQYPSSYPQQRYPTPPGPAVRAFSPHQVKMIMKTALMMTRTIVLTSEYYDDFLSALTHPSNTFAATTHVKVKDTENTGYLFPEDLNELVDRL